MYSKILVSVVWAIGIVSCFVMKKIQPDSFKQHCVYVLILCVPFTVPFIIAQFWV